MRKHLFILLIVFSSTLNAHKDFCTSFTEGNVISRIRTGWGFEIIKQAELVAKLVNELASDLQYEDSILINFNHNHINWDFPCNYEIGFNQMYQWGDDFKRGRFHGDLVTPKAIATLHIVNQKYEVLEILKLAEAIILKGDTGLTNLICGELPHFFSPDTGFKGFSQEIIHEIISAKTSNRVARIMKMRIDLASFKVNDISYYWQDDRFYLQSRIRKLNANATEPFDTLSDILQITKAGSGYFIFEDESTFRFYELNGYYSREIQLTAQSDYSYRPYEIYEISNDKFSINAKKRVSLFIYHRHQDKYDLILDLYQRLGIE